MRFISRVPAPNKKQSYNTMPSLRISGAAVKLRDKPEETASIIGAWGKP